MGYSKTGLKRNELGRFDAGYFHNKDFDDVPAGGSSDCKHVIWSRSALRNMFGMDRINATPAATTKGDGIFYFDVNGISKRVACFGDKFYEDVSGVWTDVTGSITLTTNKLVQFVNYQLNANKYVIGVNGVDAPFKWTGAGNAAVLGGSPPLFSSVAKYHEMIIGSVNELVYFSEPGAAESYNTTRDVLNFDKNVSCVLDHGASCAILQIDRIGSLTGYSYLDISKENNEIPTVGCVGRLAATNANWGKEKIRVIATLSRDGLYLIDEAYGFEKLFGDDYFEIFNQDYLHQAVVAYCKKDQLLYVALPSLESVENDYLIVVDMLNGALWPCPEIHAGFIRSMATARDDAGNEFIYFVNDAGYAFKFNRATKNYHTGLVAQAIDSRFKTKKFDLKDITQIRDIEMLADASGDWDVNVALDVSLNSDDGDSGGINLLDDDDVLGSTFILGASTLGGSNYIFKSLDDVDGFGRYFTLTFQQNELDHNFNIRKVEVITNRRRMGLNDK